MWHGLLTLTANGYVYETFGISKHIPVKLQRLLIRAEMFDNPLTAKCFICDVIAMCIFSHQTLLLTFLLDAIILLLITES
jgi:hypothetical protein